MVCPPHLAPITARIGELLQKHPATADEAKQMSEEIKPLMTLVLSQTAHPAPPMEHQTQVYQALINLTNEVVNEAAFFRGARRTDGAKSSTSSPPRGQTSK